MCTRAMAASIYPLSLPVGKQSRPRLPNQLTFGIMVRVVSGLP